MIKLPVPEMLSQSSGNENRGRGEWKESRGVWEVKLVSGWKT